MANKRNKNENEDIEIKDEPSSIAEFTRRPLPTEKEVEEFEDFIEEETKEEEIDESLSEIYQDGKGNMVDVSKLEIKKGRGFFYWFFVIIFLFAIIGAAGYGAMTYFETTGTDARAVELSIEGKNEVSAGEEFVYTLRYKNLTAVDLHDVRIEVNFPDNFIFLDSSVKANARNTVWNYDVLPRDASGQLEIKGKMVGPEDQTSIILANMTYMPANFSSEFKTSASFTTTINSIGLVLDFNYIASVLAGEENTLVLHYQALDNNAIKNFRLASTPLENMKLTLKTDSNAEAAELAEGELPDLQEIRPGVWQINNVSEEEKEVGFTYVFTDKVEDKQTVDFSFEQESIDGKYFQFYSESLEFEIMKSDLNLTLIINGSREDQGVDFGDTLNYSIVFSNKGETEMKDVVIMAVLNGDWLDWTTLSDTNQGKEKGNTLSWSKSEIEELELVERDEEGTIDFSIQLGQPTEILADKDYSIKSYAQFSIGNKEELTENTDTQSNTIVNRINSDLDLEESVRYFDDDNVAVGNGPLPPKVGEKTSFKVYWTLTNNLHELNKTIVEVKLPENVEYDSKSRSSVGAINYVERERKVVWEIGRLPITVYRADAEFNISVTPSEDDKNKVMVIMPGSRVSAIDADTEAEIEKTTKAQTTKLEDDDIANSDGIVR